MTDTADRVAMRQAEIAYFAEHPEHRRHVTVLERTEIHRIAAALSSHGLSKAVARLEYHANGECYCEFDDESGMGVTGPCDICLDQEALTALLGETASVPQEKQDD